MTPPAAWAWACPTPSSAARSPADPAFRAPTGQFDRQYLSQIISAQQMTESEFILDRRDAYTRAQLIQAFGSGSVTPEAYMRAVHEYRDVQRNVSLTSWLSPRRPRKSAIPATMT